MMDIQTFFKHSEELLNRLKIVLIPFFITLAIVLFFGYNTIKMYHVTIYYPIPDFIDSFSVHFFKFLTRNLLPKGLTLLNIGAFDVLIVNIYSGIALALMLNTPLIFYELYRYIAPALYKKEKKIIMYILGPSILLFLGGVVFSYYIVIPILFKMLLILSKNVGAMPTISIKSFISTVIILLILLGIAFQTPIVMVLLTYLKIVKPNTWFRSWRYAIIGAFFIALIISPGATGGIIETTIAVIILLLYFIGAVISRKIYKP